MPEELPPSDVDTYFHLRKKDKRIAAENERNVKRRVLVILKLVSAQQCGFIEWLDDFQ